MCAGKGVLPPRGVARVSRVEARARAAAAGGSRCLFWRTRGGRGRKRAESARWEMRESRSERPPRAALFCCAAVFGACLLRSLFFSFFLPSCACVLSLECCARVHMLEGGVPGGGLTLRRQAFFRARPLFFASVLLLRRLCGCGCGCVSKSSWRPITCQPAHTHTHAHAHTRRTTHTHTLGHERRGSCCGVAAGSSRRRERGRRP